MFLVRGPKEKILAKDQLPVHLKHIELVRRPVSEDIVVRVVQNIVFANLHVVNHLFQLFEISVKQISRIGQLEVLAVSLAEIKEEFVAHKVTVLDLLSHFRSYRVFQLLLLPVFAVEQLHHVVHERLDVVYDEVRCPDLVVHQLLAERLVVVNFVLLG